MQNLLKTLRKKLEIAKKVLVLGIGSELLGDDCAGLLVAGRLKEIFKKKLLGRKFKALSAGTVPENFTGLIKKFKPTHLVIVDAADLGKKAGSIAVLKPEDTTGVTFSTHRLPTKILTDYLVKSLACEITIIGIQPKSLIFSAAPSKEIKRAVEVLVNVLTHECCAVK